ncbi:MULTISPECIES: ADP-ribosylglycohydrolase family protein [unclassified Lentimonas]|uniref:ADP-ribosylglycohydrolase family protein n=1 Tax=unclassified Lentimonas TaxID=2630993 RepID=UPI001321814B|nr:MULTISPECIES: ADP-ribosylglycohydrolase family protein [unclassified Lentimonas]CAA6679212.1 Unannotated [Lentimonas sp. CC4]CAA6685876.1 Unannotated [Lentimonas sp. CC6]CAA7076033.1 Unannotated [Lentimonas sp. CC4]CAA7168534.1 Unannotated [Lentimonas sp. CC21]CAA7180928.1 Unannotated [Lentimonas sp. CC8]
MQQFKKITSQHYLDTIRGMWVGKFLGGTLGAPIEGIKDIHTFTPADLQPELAENDDTDLQLLWLHALEEHGVELTGKILAEEWMEHYPTPWCEYGIMMKNWRSGLQPPETGKHNNWFYHEGMGCPIRSEIWGAVCAGSPELAARFAEMDGTLDHHGDSVEAEKFLAAIDAAVFVEKDIERLLDIGQAVVDPASTFYALVRDARQWATNDDWATCRRKIINTYGHPEMTHVLENLGFIILGLIQGKGDFGATICAAINCGYDSDCTAASAGAIIGGILGFSGLPEHLKSAVPNSYQLSDWMKGFPREGSLDELCNACGHWAQKIATHHNAPLELEGEYTYTPLAVAPQPLPTKIAETPQHAKWAMIGPFTRPWTERLAQRTDFPDHGHPTMPSVEYCAMNTAGFNTDYLNGEATFDNASLSMLPADIAQLIQAQDDRVPTADLNWPQRSPYSYYAYTELSLEEAERVWLLLGSSGPLKVWIDGELRLESNSYQQFTPVSFSIDQQLDAGLHRVLIKAEVTSNKPELYFALKEHKQEHWHQNQYFMDFTWQPVG